jgi:hypothetical protein
VVTRPDKQLGPVGASSSAGRAKIAANVGADRTGAGAGVGAQSARRLGGAGSAEHDRFARVRRGRKVFVGACVVAGIVVLTILSVRARAVFSRHPSSSSATVAGAAEKSAGEAFVLVTFQSEPAGARIIAVDDGKLMGLTPATLPIPPSARPVTFRFEKDGFRATTSTIVPTVDRTIDVALGADPRANRHIDRRVEKTARKSAASKRGTRRR